MTKRFRWGVAAAMIVAFAGLWAMRSGEPLGLDQGLFACFGRWLRAGWLPYRDMFDSKPPLHLYTWVLAWLGGTPLSAWVFEGLWLAGTGAVAFVLARRWWGAPTGLAAAAAIVIGLWAPGLGGYWSRLQAEELLALPLLGAAWFAAGPRARPLVCGVLIGIAGLYKVPALAVGLAWPALWWASDRSSALRRTAWLAAGVAIPWAVACAWFALHGALGAFLDSVFVYQRHWIKMIDPPWGDTLRTFVSTSARALAPLWIAAATGIWLSDRTQRAFLLVWLGAAALAIVLQRQLAPYHFLLLVPPLALASARGVAALAARRDAALAILAVVALALAVTARDWAIAYGHDDYTRDQFAPAAEREVADYIAAHSAPGDGILVWALAPGIYALADRHPVTRYPFHRLLYTDAPLAHEVPGREERRRDLLQRLRDDPPAFVVIGLRDANPFEPQDSMTSLFAWRELGELVTRDYREAMRDAKFVVLARAAAR